MMTSHDSWHVPPDGSDPLSALPPSFLSFLKDNAVDANVFRHAYTIPRFVRLHPARAPPLPELELELGASLAPTPLRDFFQLDAAVKIAHTPRCVRCMNIQPVSEALIMNHNWRLPSSHVTQQLSIGGHLWNGPGLGSGSFRFGSPTRGTCAGLVLCSRRETLYDSRLAPHRDCDWRGYRTTPTRRLSYHGMIRVDSFQHFRFVLLPESFFFLFTFSA
jgi:hypothetical protein